MWIRLGRARRGTNEPAHEFAVSSVDEEHKDEQRDKEHRGVGVRGQEGRLESTVHGVGDHTPRDEERGQVEVHPREGVHGGSTTEEKHGGNDDVGQ